MIFEPTSAKLLVILTTVIEVNTSMITIARQLAGVHSVIGIDLLGNTLTISMLATNPICRAKVKWAYCVEKAAQDEQSKWNVSHFTYRRMKINSLLVMTSNSMCL